MTRLAMRLAERTPHFGPFASRYEIETDAEDVRLADSLLTFGHFDARYGFLPIELRWIDPHPHGARPRMPDAIRVQADGVDLIDPRRLANVHDYQLPQEPWSAERHGCLGTPLLGDERGPGHERCGRSCADGYKYLCRAHAEIRATLIEDDLRRQRERTQYDEQMAKLIRDVLAGLEADPGEHTVPVGTKRRDVP